MALITAVFGSLIGAVLGVVSMVAFDVSLLGAFGVYMLVSIGCIGAGASALLMAPDTRVAAYGVFEGELDESWQEYESQTRKMTAEEAEFNADLERPLSEDDRQNKQVS